LYSQPKSHRLDGFKISQQLLPTVQVIPKSESQISVSYLYRIPYNLLIFEKNGNSFKASLRTLVEVYKDDELVERDYEDKKITVDDFEITKSKSASIEGYINFDLYADNYTFKGVVTDLFSSKEIRFFPEQVDGVKSIESGIFDPIIINFSESNCNSKNHPLVVNHGGSIPYDPKDYQLLIPVADTTIEKITIELRNNDEESTTQTITESYITGISSQECNGKLFIGNDVNVQKTKNFILRNFSRKLNEGLLLATVTLNEDGEEQEFHIKVMWLRKPISLRNPEFAIEMLQYIEGDKIVSELLDEDEEDYPKIMHEYWRQFDPTPETEYNELMEEFYSRIDYAAFEFRGISNKNGFSTDRGKVYIRNGKPDKIERSSNELGNVMESWIYSNPKQTFLFVDKQGTGNFILIES
jgi:GWxTD domain-containing protein